MSRATDVPYSVTWSYCSRRDWHRGPAPHPGLADRRGDHHLVTTIRIVRGTPPQIDVTRPRRTT
jgi:hypothetical protein